MITVSKGWTQSDLYVQDLRTGVERKAPVQITEGKNFLYGGEIFDGKIYITTNEDAPRYRMFAVDATSPARANWKEIIPQNDAVLQGAAIVNGLLLAQYEKNATSQLTLLRYRRQAARRCAASRHWQRFRIGRQVGPQRSFLRIPFLHRARFDLSD